MSKPNIILMLMDDLGYGDLGCYNLKSKIPTPNLDKLAEQGVRFTDAHAPSSVCTPTRYSVLTGQYCWRTELKRGVLRQAAPPLIPDDRLTIGKMLQKCGYNTAAIGKWHLGQTWHVTGGNPQPTAESGEIDWSRPAISSPNDRGFDYHYGLCRPAWGFQENGVPVEVPTEEFDLTEIGPYLIGPNNITGMQPPGYKHEQMLPRFTEKAVEYIKDQADSEKPFFMYWSPMTPHKPVVPNKEYIGKSEAGLYGDFVVELDDCIGKIMAALDEAGVADNTLMIFTADNGPETTCYDRIEEHDHYSMGDWRGVKRDTWEGGHREPFIARWPARIPAGTTNDETICLIDIMATAAEIVGFELPNDAAEDSVSVLSALLGEELSEPLREATVHHACDGHLAIRQGNWVYIDNETGESNRLEPQWFRDHLGGAEVNEGLGVLYNLKEDPTECFNVIEKHREKAEKLKALLNQYRESGRSVPKRGEA